jgi:hypothetical protein
VDWTTTATVGWRRSSPAPQPEVAKPSLTARLWKGSNKTACCRDSATDAGAQDRRHRAENLEERRVVRSEETELGDIAVSSSLPALRSVVFVTQIIKFGSEINSVAFKTVNFASPIIDFGLETINSAPDTVNFGFNMINVGLETIISGVQMIIVKVSTTKCVLVATFSMTEIIIDATEIIIDAMEIIIDTIVAVFSTASK